MNDSILNRFLILTILLNRFLTLTILLVVHHDGRLTAAAQEQEPPSPFSIKSAKNSRITANEANVAAINDVFNESFVNELIRTTDSECPMLPAALWCQRRFKNLKLRPEVKNLVTKRPVVSEKWPTLKPQCFPQQANSLPFFRVPLHYFYPSSRSCSSILKAGFRRFQEFWSTVVTSSRNQCTVRNGDKIVGYLAIFILPAAYGLLLIQLCLSLFSFNWLMNNTGGSSTNHGSRNPILLHQIALCVSDFITIHIQVVIWYFRSLNLNVYVPCHILAVLPYRSLNFTLTLLGPLYLIGIMADQVDSLRRLSSQVDGYDNGGSSAALMTERTRIKRRVVGISLSAWSIVVLVTAWLHFEASDASNVFRPHYGNLPEDVMKSMTPRNFYGKLREYETYRFCKVITGGDEQHRYDVCYGTIPAAYAFLNDHLIQFNVSHRRPTADFGEDKLRLYNCLRRRRTKLEQFKVSFVSTCPFHDIDWSVGGTVAFFSLSILLILTMTSLSITLTVLYRKQSKRLLAEHAAERVIRCRNQQHENQGAATSTAAAGNNNQSSAVRGGGYGGSGILIFGGLLQSGLQTALFSSICVELFISVWKKSELQKQRRNPSWLLWYYEVNLGLMYVFGILNYLEHFLIFLFISKRFRQSVKRLVLLEPLRKRLREWILSIV